MRYLKRKKIGIIGLGNMGQAILRGLAGQAGACRRTLGGYDRDTAKARSAGRALGVSIYPSAMELAGSSDIIIIAVKPQNFGELARELSGNISGKLVISVAAGIGTRHIEKTLGAKTRVVRVMPNTPALVGAGITAVCKGRYATASDLKAAEEVFSSVGDTVAMNERYFDLVTAISGSGPAYFFYLKEALIEAAVRMGMGKDVAKVLVSRTALGAAKLLIETGHEPGILRQRVTSKGGTTEEAIKVFDKAEFKRVVEKAVIAAARRSRELSGG
jgi:pyrroline-5-carboxylate reductase